MMAIARILSAVLIALSVAWAPLANGAAPPPAEMSMTDGGDHDCCPGAVQPCDMTEDGCLSMASCGLLSTALSGPVILDIAFPPIATGPTSLPPRDALYSRTSGPPTRPPQV